MITGIVVALPEELSTLTAKKLAKGEVLFLSERVLVAYAGTGHANATQAAHLLVANGAKKLISWGCAGALADYINSGDLILANRLVDAKGDLAVSTSISSEWHAHSHNHLSNYVTIHSGLLVESTVVVSSSTDKQKLYQETGALAVDMESIAVAKVAQHHNHPFLVIRSIVDPAHLNLPLAISRSVNGQGDVVMRLLLLYILRNPSEIPALIKLGRHFGAATKTLKIIAIQLDYLIDHPNSAELNTQPI